MNVIEVKKYLNSLMDTYGDVDDFYLEMSNIINSEMTLEDISMSLRNYTTRDIDEDLKTNLKSIINQLDVNVEPTITDVEMLEDIPEFIPLLERIVEEPIVENDLTLGVIDKYNEELKTLGDNEIGLLLIAPKVDNAEIISVTLSKKLKNSTLDSSLNDIFSFDYDREQFFQNQIYDKLINNFAKQDKISVNGTDPDATLNTYIYYGSLKNGNELKITNISKEIYDRTKIYIDDINKDVIENTIKKESNQINKLATNTGFTNYLLLSLLLMMIIGCILFTVYLFK